MEPINKYQFFLNKDQAERQSRSSPYCEFRFKQQLTVTSPQYIFEVIVNRVSIPLSFYQFNANNNKLKWTITAAIPVGLIGLTDTIVITPGNYTLAEFFTELNTLFLPSLQSQSGLFLAATWTFQYNSVTNKAEYKLATNVGICTIEFDKCQISHSLGFAGIWNIVCNDPNWKKAPHTVNMVPIANVYVTSTILNDNTSFEALGGTIDLSQVIATVPMDYLNIHYCSVEFNNPIRVRITNDTLSAIDFNLTDSQGNVLACDQPWSLQLTIQEILAPVTVQTNIKENLQLISQATSNTTAYNPDTYSIYSQLKNELLNRAQGDLIDYVSKRRKTS